MSTSGRFPAILHYNLSESFPAAANLRGADSQSAASAFQPAFFSFVAPAIFVAGVFGRASAARLDRLTIGPQVANVPHKSDHAGGRP